MRDRQSKLKSLPSDDAQGNVHPIRRLYACSFASDAWMRTDVLTYTRDRPGMSAFVLEDGVVYRIYSTYARRLDGLWGMYP